jgi:hypothetical protein
LRASHPVERNMPTQLPELLLAAGKKRGESMPPRLVHCEQAG